MLPGICGVPFSAAPPTFSLVSSTLSTIETIAWPTVQGGDLAVLFDWGDTPSPTLVVPTGFTGLVNYPNFSGWSSRIAYSAKKCTGSETGNITGMGGVDSIAKRLLIFRPTSSWDSFTLVTYNADISDVGNHSPLSLTFSGNTGPAFVFTSMSSTGSTVSFSASPTMDTFYPTGTPANLKVGFKFYASGVSTENITLSASDEGSDNALVGALLRINI